MSVNGHALSLEEVTRRLTRIAENFPGQPVVIRADKTCSYETLMSLIDACRTANVWNFSLATEDDKKGE